MPLSESLAIVDAINAICKEKPLVRAVEDPRFGQLQQRLRESDWRTLTDEIRRIGGEQYCTTRLVRRDSPECIAVYGKPD